MSARRVDQRGLVWARTDGQQRQRVLTQVVGLGSVASAALVTGLAATYPHPGHRPAATRVSPPATTTPRPEPTATPAKESVTPPGPAPALVVSSGS